MREFTTPKGTTLPLMDIKGKPYLSVQHRVVWFREEKPLWTIETYTEDRGADGTHARCLIKDETGRLLSTGTKREDANGFPDHMEKAESGAVGRALGFLGYGTAFALELEEGDRLADAPTNEVEKKSTSLPSNSARTHLSGSEVNESQSDDLGSYKVSFGKFKNRTLRDLAENEGPHKISSYIQWLESDAKVKNKPVAQNAKEFIEAFDAFVGNSELDKAIDRPPKDKSVHDQLARLKNQFPGVPGPAMPVAYKDAPDYEEPFPDNP